MRRREFLAAAGATVAGGCVAPSAGPAVRSFGCPPVSAAVDEGRVREVTCARSVDPDRTEVYLSVSSTTVRGDYEAVRVTLHNGDGSRLLVDPHGWTIWRYDEFWSQLDDLGAVDAFPVRVPAGETYSWSLEEILRGTYLLDGESLAPGVYALEQSLRDGTVVCFALLRVAG